MRAIQLKVHGLVQGVFFRKHTREKAEELNINGTVRNCQDGSVEIIAEGTEDQLSSFTAWCKSGPGRSRVDRVDIHELPLKNYSDFRIIH
jgi:acylphosphatase